MKNPQLRIEPNLSIYADALILTELLSRVAVDNHNLELKCRLRSSNFATLRAIVITFSS